MANALSTSMPSGNSRAKVVRSTAAPSIRPSKMFAGERILIHYNGQGVPRPTDHSEIWVFDKIHTEYIPLGIADLKQWIGKQAIVVLDCSAAGILIPFFTANDEASTANNSVNSGHNNNDNTTPHINEQASQWVRDSIVLCPCSEMNGCPCTSITPPTFSRRV